MKKMIVTFCSFYALLGNAALTREEQRRVTEGIVMTTLLPDSREIEENGFPELAQYMRRLIRVPHVNMFNHSGVCDLITRFLQCGGLDLQLVSTQHGATVSRALGALEAIPRVQDFLDYLRPVRHHIARGTSFCAANHGLYFANLYATHYNMDEELPVFRQMIQYIRDHQESYANPLEVEHQSRIESLIRLREAWMTHRSTALAEAPRQTLRHQIARVVELPLPSILPQIGVNRLEPVARVLLEPIVRFSQPLHLWPGVGRSDIRPLRRSTRAAVISARAQIKEIAEYERKDKI